MSISRKQFLKNAVLFGVGSTCFNQNLFAKNELNPPTCPSIPCGLDLTSDTTPFSDILVRNYSYATTGTIDPALRDIKFYREYAKNTLAGDCVHSEVLPDDYVCEDPLASLIYDVYYPTKAKGITIDYSTCATLPAVIFAHSGGFSDCSSKDIPGISIYATEFAKRGFICFSIEYRRGVQLDYMHRVYTSVQQEIAIYRACQDARGAIRTIIQRHGTYNDFFQIDTSSVFVGGNSAGSLAMLNAAYYSDPTIVYPIFPKLAGSSINIQQALGPINANFYDCDSSQPYIGNIKGVINLWGSISLPPSYFNNEASYFMGQSTPPVISFHGFKDDVFPVYSQDLKFAPPSDPAFNSESRCLRTSPFATEGIASTVDLKNYGSLGLVSQVLQPLNVFFEVYIDCTMMHGLDTNGPDYASDFGTGATNSTDTQIYIVKRAATFFQAILNGKANTLRDNSTIHKFFYDCANSRNKCQLINNDNNCNNTNPCT
ncbi:MAG: hypothetical protein ABJA35_13205 [Parafilimonas sp.]